MRILLTGGGTAGHINPAIAIANYIKEKDPQTEILFIGTAEGMEKTLVPKAGYNIEYIKVHGFKRSLSPSNIKNVIEAYFGIIKAKNHLEKIGFLEEVHRLNYGYYTNDLLRLAILSGDPMQFQRDTHKVLENKGFRIGVTDRDYKITARAKDTKKTLVTYPKF